MINVVFTWETVLRVRIFVNVGVQNAGRRCPCLVGKRAPHSCLSIFSPEEETIFASLDCATSSFRRIGFQIPVEGFEGQP